MAEDQDKAQKTEEPTQKRLDEAREKGQVASSREVNHLLMLAAATLFLATLASATTLRLLEVMRPFVEAPHAIATDPGNLGRVMWRTIGDLGAAMILPALLFLAAALATGLVQNGLVWSATPLAPKAERISPLAGAKRLFSGRSLMEFAKGVLKITLVGIAGVALLWASLPALIQSAAIEAGPLLALLHSLALRLLAGVTALVAVIALLDLAYQRAEHTKKMRMSRRDLQDEYKQTEGDPLIKARLKSLRMERARRRMMAEVPKASVVVTNPTHVAVALRYDPDTTPAPLVVAKGEGEIALRIREVARAHDVPVIENPPLARALNGAVELGGVVPQAHWRAVAELIGHVMRLRPRR